VFFQYLLSTKIDIFLFNSSNLSLISFARITSSSNLLFLFLKISHQKSSLNATKVLLQKYPACGSVLQLIILFSIWYLIKSSFTLLKSPSIAQVYIFTSVNKFCNFITSSSFGSSASTFKSLYLATGE
jgi:hypothetical protein